MYLTLSFVFKSDLSRLNTVNRASIPFFSKICFCANGNRLAIVPNA